MELLHIFRNTPFGRETLLSSSFFCKTVQCSPIIYIPLKTQFLMYFEREIVQIDLDKSFLTDSPTAQARAQDIVCSLGLPVPLFLEPVRVTAGELPDVPVNFDFMCCPRSISDLSTKIGLGYIGPKVRQIVKASSFPVLLTGPAYKKWDSITVLFGGSDNSLRALQLGLQLAGRSGLPVDVFTQAGKYSKKYFEEIIHASDLAEIDFSKVRKWYFFKKGRIQENLYHISHSALIVTSAFGHGIIKDLLLGSMVETVQTLMPNNLLLVGPNYAPKRLPET